MPRGVYRDLTGQRFELWKVLYRIPGTRKGMVTWVCICECGVTGAVPSTYLTSGRSKGCRPCGLNLTRERRRAERKKAK